jgi:hypothetical protein
VYRFASELRFKTGTRKLAEAQSILKPSFNQVEKHTFALDLARTSGRKELFPDLSARRGQVSSSELPSCAKYHSTMTDRFNSLETSLRKRVLVNLKKQPGR